MTPEELRLECARLVYRHDRSPEDAVKAARAIEAYVAGDGNDGTSKGQDSTKPVKADNRKAR